MRGAGTFCLAGVFFADAFLAGVFLADFFVAGIEHPPGAWLVLMTVVYIHLVRSR